MSNKWPRLDYLSWRETCSALHLYLQVVGKYRLGRSRTPDARRVRSFPFARLPTPRLNDNLSGRTF
jgi:hypothetical protein